MNRIEFLRVVCSTILVCSLVLLYSCGNNKSPEQTSAAADSVSSPVDTIVYIDSLDIYQMTTPEDTIKARKIVYVADGGATAYTEMDDNTATSSVLPFGAPLEVLEEYPDWYKVRFRNNSEIYLFYVLKQATSAENPIALTLFYPAFQVVLNGFQHSEDYVTTADRFYYQEGSEHNISNVQIIQKDSTTLYESMDSYNVIKHIKIAAKNTADRFVISLAYGQHIGEVTAYTKPKSERHFDKQQHWFELTPYKILPDTGGVFLPIFYYNITQAEEIFYRTAMGKKYGLKDTLMIIPREYDITVNFVKNGRYFTYGLGALYLRVQRFSDGKLAETRYVVIRQDESGC
jgi:hypothetical protein